MSQRNLEQLCQQLLRPERLNDTDNLVLRLSLQGQTYQQIANSSGYNNDYIRDVGYRLWGKLSRKIGTKVTKKNVNSILQQHISQTALQSKRIFPYLDWTTAPEPNIFYGRTQELNQLKQWIIKERCHLVNIYGMGGIGKTLLATCLAKEVCTEFDFVIRLRLSNTSIIEPTLFSIIKFIAKQQATKLSFSQNLNEIIRQLLYCLYQFRCLLILDNVETILEIQRINHDGLKSYYKKEYQGYAQLLETIVNSPHQSCLLLTSRQLPSHFVSLSRKDPMIHLLQLSGLNISECQLMLQHTGIRKSSEDSIKELINYYGGNPFVLKIVATSIVDLFNGDLEAFWHSGVRLFGEIKDLLDQHWQSLSTQDKDVMFGLAKAKEPVPFACLTSYFTSIKSHSQLLTVLLSLSRRSLIERNHKGFTQQPFVMDYVVEKISESN